MKFKQTDGQNQRIERITISHLVVGIDMAKETHVAQATNYRGIDSLVSIFPSKTHFKALKSYIVGWTD